LRVRTLATQPPWRHNCATRPDATLESQDDLDVERFIASYTRVKAGDSRKFSVGAEEEDRDDRFEVLSVTIH
jgi:hypothetical protein